MEHPRLIRIKIPVHLIISCNVRTDKDEDEEVFEAINNGDYEVEDVVDTDSTKSSLMRDYGTVDQDPLSSDDR